MKKRSAGILLYRGSVHELEVFLVHPGGPFWVKKDSGAWSIPKGEYADGEDAFAAARREFQEETGFPVTDGRFLPLGDVKQPGGKMVTVWALEQDADPALLRSNTFDLEWPPKSGKVEKFPEVDAGGWFSIPLATTKLLKGQLEFLARLLEALAQPRNS
jgi:predicted NUDIX family NTP pyrophosphohydrolase